MYSAFFSMRENAFILLIKWFFLIFLSLYLSLSHSPASDLMRDAIIIIIIIIFIGFFLSFLKNKNEFKDGENKRIGIEYDLCDGA